ncbi:MAG: Minf_1886 family protein [Planctomycetota bacterium]
MLDPKHPLAELLSRDQRYHLDSYVFVFDSLRFAQETLNMGGLATTPPGQEQHGHATHRSGEGPAASQSSAAEDPDQDDGDDGPVERHITGQDLCEAIRRYALSQYGLLARCVFDHWGIRTTDDFGEIVFNLIDIGQMRKTENDRREDFSGVFEFEQALSGGGVFASDDRLKPNAGGGESGEPGSGGPSS